MAALLRHIAKQMSSNNSWFDDQVQNSPFWDMVRQQTDTVKELLCRWSGVEEVNIRWHSYRSKRHHYLVVSAIGRQWQLCCFDELMLQPWLQNAIVNRRLA